MKRAAFMTWAFFILLGSLPVGYGRAEELKICVPDNYAPYSSLDKSNNFIGFDIELWKAINLQMPFKYVAVDFSSGLAGLEDKSCSLFLTNLSITRERAKRIDFSKPYLKSGLAVMVLKENTAINTLADLKGKVIAVANGTTGDSYVTDNVKASAIVAMNSDDRGVLDLLLSGDVDALVHDLPILQHLADTVARGRVRILETMLSEEEYALGLPKGSPLKPLLDARIAELKAGGIIDGIYKKIFRRGS